MSRMNASVRPNNTGLGIGGKLMLAFGVVAFSSIAAAAYGIYSFISVGIAQRQNGKRSDPVGGRCLRAVADQR